MTSVMLLIQHLGPGGSERQLFEVASNLDRTRFTPHVACFRTDGIMDQRLRERGIPVLQLPVNSFASAAALHAAWDLGRYLIRQRIAIVHAFDVPMHCFAIPVARAARVPVVLSSQRGHRDLFPPRYRRWMRFFDRFAEGMVVNCDFLRRHLHDDERVPLARIHVCPNGVNASLFQRGSMRTSGCIIGTVAVLRPEKDISTLLYAFAQVLEERSDARLVITGSGPDRETLEELAHSLNLGDNCRFEPATDSVPRALEALDVFVLPSRSEALSNSLMEAMAAGLCVIASNVGGNPELVTDGETGLLFEPGDASGLARLILRSFADASLRQRLGESAARRMREEFSIAASVRRFEKLYDGFVDRH